MFEHVETYETIYEGVAKKSYQKTNRTNANGASKTRKTGGVSTLSKTHSNMIIRAGKCNQRYVYCPRENRKRLF